MFQVAKGLIVLALLSPSISSGFAQQQELPPSIGRQMQPQGNGGGVTGRVICADTQHAARFANVTLIPVEEVNSSERDRESRGRRSGARTDLDGVFTATHVQPGDYYVSASATGYISEGMLLAAAGADPASALAKLPTVHVTAASVSTVNLTLERGGVISGRIQWEDGTPAAGVQVNAVSAVGSAPDVGRMFGFFGGLGGNFAQTDDRGRFRLTGLPPGSYLVHASVQTPLPGDAFGRGYGVRQMNVAIYAPGKVRRTEAQTVLLHAAEERDDVNMVMDLGSLHRVTGRVSAASGSVASGAVRLTDTQDASLTRTAQVNADGSYVLMYVPAGNYSFSVPFASSTPGQVGRPRGGSDGQAVGFTFQPFQQTVSVTDGDLTGLDVTLTPATQASK